MLVERITNLQALAFVGGILAFAFILFRLIPSGDQEPPEDHFSPNEIRAYDRELPKYFLAAALALILGGAHTVIKSLPGFWQWLWRAGYGGHLFRDLSNSHIIIVGGGTVLLTAITWYVLPRFTGRPLFSTSLASISFWLTVVGVFGFYAAWLVLGLIEGNMVAHGWDYMAAKSFLGNWHKIPTAITSSIMGFGYWTYVLNVFLTALAARRVRFKPLGYLTKFALVSAGALFVGTVQGVIQVLPKNADWIHAAGKFGQYVDPISHAHVNLVTGMMISLAAFLLYFGPQLGKMRHSRQAANWIFWTLTPGSIAFYLAFLFLGLILGGASNGYGGIQAGGWVPFLSRNMRWILAGVGSFMLFGFWVYFMILWRGLQIGGIAEQFKQATPAAFWLVSSLALVVGTFQGMLQVFPATARILTTPEEIPNIHAQLNMIGGVILALLGTVYWLLPHTTGQRASQANQRRSLVFISAGIGGYYLVTLISGLLRFRYLQAGLDDVQAALRLGWTIPAFLFLTALPMLAGYLAFGQSIWEATAQYRSEWRARIIHLPDRYNGPAPAWLNHIPKNYFLAAELFSAAVGFPGLGWLLSGQGLVGVPLGLTGPALAWGVLPILISPYGSSPLVPFGLKALVFYLALTASLSTLLLWASLERRLASKEQG